MKALLLYVLAVLFRGRELEADAAREAEATDHQFGSEA